MSARILAVLGYHKIGRPPAGTWTSWFYVPADVFARQLRELSRSGWSVIGAEAFVDAVTGGAALPERVALLTFDDGYRSMRDVALPVLAGLGMPSVLFVPTAFVGLRNAFDCGIEPEEPICDWDELRELQRHGVSIQSHGVSHRRLSELGPQEWAAELGDSKRQLETELGRSVELFAFPYGDDGALQHPGVRRALEHAGYRAAFTYRGSPVTLPVADRYRIERIAIGPDTDLASALECT